METIKEVIQRCIENGVSVIPVGENKKPSIGWKEYHSSIISFEKISKRIDKGDMFGVVCGYANIECIDFDLKYAPSGFLMKDFYNAIMYIDDIDVKSFYIQKTVNNGIHFVYKCNFVEGNQKLAMRNPIGDEKSPQCFIETRGTGGQFVCAPSPGYEVKQGDIIELPEITVEQRKQILDICKGFGEILEEVKPKVKKKKKEYPPIMEKESKSIWDEFNKSFHILDELKKEGWVINKEEMDRFYVLRPGSTSEHSGYMYKDSHMFYLWTNNAFPLEQKKTYSPASILINFICKGDKKAAYKVCESYGLIDPRNPVVSPVAKREVDDYIIDSVSLRKDVEDIKYGRVPMGLTTGIPTLDEHFRFKKPNFVVFLGRDNVGKSVVTWYLSFLSACLHGWHWAIICYENKPKYVYRKLIEFYCCKDIEKISDEEFSEAYDFVSLRFKIIDTANLESYKNIFGVLDQVNAIFPLDAVMIDPINSLDRGSVPMYEHNTQLVNYIHKWKNKNNISVYVNAHAVTSANRMNDNGVPKRPTKYDIEGGSKFPGGADEFITIDRDTQNEITWNINEIHVDKVKERETGGKPTFRDKPVKIKITRDFSGFEVFDDIEGKLTGYNPVIEYRRSCGKPVTIDIKESNTGGNVQGLLAIKQEVPKGDMWWMDDAGEVEPDVVKSIPVKENIKLDDLPF